MIRILSLAVLFSCATAFAADGDLQLPGERWLTKHNGYVCNPMQNGSAQTPAALAAINAKFEGMSTDFSLDNALLLGTFDDAGTTCRYSALILADNSTQHSRLQQSKAFAPSGEEICARGKAILDGLLADVDYLYYGHPHHVAFMMKTDDAEAICGAGNKVIGLDFVLTGRKQD